MAKRFGDSNIWKTQRWFRKLHPDYKLAFLYIKDQCDHAGIWNIDCTDLIEDLGINQFDINQFITSCNTEYDKNTGDVRVRERLRLLDKGYLWVTGFIQFQYKGKEGLVNPYAAPVRTALQILSGFKLLNEALAKSYITLTEPLPEGYLTPKDKDKDKDKKGVVGENKNGHLAHAVKIDLETLEAIFEDGFRQPLGLEQKQSLQENVLQAHYVKRGKIQ